MSRFGKQVGDFRRKYQAKLRAVGRTAVQDTISIAQRTRPEGGRMRIDTGFLRASVQAALGTMPRGPTDNKLRRKYAPGTQAHGVPVPAVLLRWDPSTGQSLFVGWTAGYARPREYHDGFLRGAVELWPQTVKIAAKKVESGLAK